MCWMCLFSPFAQGALQQQQAKMRSLALHGHVGFDSLPDQLVNKSVSEGFTFNVLCIGLFALLNAMQCIRNILCAHIHSPSYTYFAAISGVNWYENLPAVWSAVGYSNALAARILTPQTHSMHCGRFVKRERSWTQHLSWCLGPSTGALLRFRGYPSPPVKWRLYMQNPAV